MRKVRNIVTILSLLALMATLVPGHVAAQEEISCESDVVVQADDWLSKIAEKFYGDPLAFPAIAAATNAQTDESYATIDNVDVIEVGWKLCIPAVEMAETLLSDPNATVTAGTQELPEIGTLQVGVIPILAGSPFFVAKENGYFEEQGLDVEFQTFRSAGVMYAPLSTGDLDVGFGQAGPGLFNAIDQGFDIRAVAAAASQPEGFGAVPLLIRSDLADEITTPGDLAGRKVAINVPRGVAEYLLAEALARDGLTVDDVEIVALPFPEMPQAFANDAIDAATLPHPLAARAIGEGVATALLDGDEIVDNPQNGVIYFGQRMLRPENREVGVRFLVAYLKGIRDVSGDKWRNDENVAIINQYTNVPAPAIKNGVPYFFDPNGETNRASIERQIDYHFNRGYTELTEPLSVDQILDESYLQKALARQSRLQ